MTSLASLALAAFVACGTHGVRYVGADERCLLKSVCNHPRYSEIAWWNGTTYMLKSGLLIVCDVLVKSLQKMCTRTESLEKTTKKCATATVSSYTQNYRTQVGALVPHASLYGVCYGCIVSRGLCARPGTALAHCARHRRERQAVPLGDSRAILLQ